MKGNDCLREYIQTHTYIHIYNPKTLPLLIFLNLWHFSIYSINKWSPYGKFSEWTCISMNVPSFRPSPMRCPDFSHIEFTCNRDQRRGFPSPRRSSLIADCSLLSIIFVLIQTRVSLAKLETRNFLAREARPSTAMQLCFVLFCFFVFMPHRAVCMHDQPVLVLWSVCKHGKHELNAEQGYEFLCVSRPNNICMTSHNTIS